jgi:hypothetical protein
MLWTTLSVDMRLHLVPNEALRLHRSIKNSSVSEVPQQFGAVSFLVELVRAPGAAVAPVEVGGQEELRGWVRLDRPLGGAKVETPLVMIKRSSASAEDTSASGHLCLRCPPPRRSVA